MRTHQCGTPLFSPFFFRHLFDTVFLLTHRLLVRHHQLESAMVCDHVIAQTTTDFVGG